MKALLTRHQIEFPKTHVIRRLLILLEPVDPAMVEALDDANWLSPFGAEIRYPGDRAEALPGEEVRALQLAQKVRDAAMAVLDPYLAGGGRVVGDLILQSSKGAKGASIEMSDYGFPTFRCARPVTTEDVKALDDEE